MLLSNGYMQTHTENTSCHTGCIVVCMYCRRCLEMGLLYYWLSIYCGLVYWGGLHVTVFYLDFVQTTTSTTATASSYTSGMTWSWFGIKVTTLSASLHLDYMVSDVRMINDFELWYYPGFCRGGGDIKNLSYSNWCHGWDLNWAPSKIQVYGITTTPSSHSQEDMWVI
jgi:hypothetical protein